MQFDREKLQELVLYIVSACGPQELGAVKLHKVLYFSDMLTFINEGRPLTGATYRKRPYGPTCEQLSFALHSLEKAKRITIEEERYFGFLKKTYQSVGGPDLHRFSDQEIAIVDEMIEFVCRQNSARSISEISHSPAWELADFGEDLAYESAFLMLSGPVSQDAMDWVSEEAQDIEAARSVSNPLDLEDFAAFRGRLHKVRETLRGDRSNAGA